MSGDDLAAFRAEMVRRGVYKRGEPRFFTPNEKIRRGRPAEDLSDFRAEMEKRRRIPTGPQKIVDAAAITSKRESARAFYGAIVQSAKARLGILDGRSGFDSMPCPWAALTPCSSSCRCKGTGAVLVAILRAHAAWMAAEYARFA